MWNAFFFFFNLIFWPAPTQTEGLYIRSCVGLADTGTRLKANDSISPVAVTVEGSGYIACHSRTKQPSHYRQWPTSASPPVPFSKSVALDFGFGSLFPDGQSSRVPALRWTGSCVRTLLSCLMPARQVGPLHTAGSLTLGSLPFLVTRREWGVLVFPTFSLCFSFACSCGPWPQFLKSVPKLPTSFNNSSEYSPFWFLENFFFWSTLLTNNGLTRKLTRVILYHRMGKPKWTSWPAQYIESRATEWCGT